LVLNEHGSHVTIKAIEHAITFGLDMVTLPSHTSYAFQPLYVTYFKPLKNAFRKEQDFTMAKNNYSNQTMSHWQNGWTRLCNVPKKHKIKV
jgi:hypothetical protein